MRVLIPSWRLHPYSKTALKDLNTKNNQSLSLRRSLHLVMAVWFITGCSSGFGKEVAKEALARGDKVVATARNTNKLEDLKILGALTLSLDVTDAEAEIEKVVAEAIKTY
jgi:NADP-dependent 3-hydroxy acid dehydrogenase YdfG